MPIERVGDDGTLQPISDVERVASDGSLQSAVAVERVMSDGTLQEVWPPDTADPEPTGPSGTWNLVVQDEFDQGSLDTNLWGVNAGEFVDPFDDDATNDVGHVSVSNDTLTLEVSSDGTGAGGCYQGAISTYPGTQDYHATTGFATGNVPGVYIETRAQLAGPRNGLLPAFWLNAFGSDAWPPEIDIYELFQTTASSNTAETHHSGHWATTEQPGDLDNHLGMGYVHDHGADTTAGMHTYGSAWFQDRIEFWVDGVHEGTLNLLPMLRTMNSADRNDMYMKFTTHVNRVGSADLTASWSEESVVDYVRVWEWGGTTHPEPSPPAFTTVDDFDDSSIAAGWNDPNGAWTQSTTYSNTGSYSLSNTAINAPIGWEGTPSFAPGRTGTRLEFDFAFGGDASNRLNTRFGSTGATDTESYRLDILSGGDVYLFETSGWNALHHDANFTAGAAGEFFTGEIEFTDHNIRYEIRDAAGAVVSTHARYHTEGFTGPVFSFSAEEGTVYIDEVRVASGEIDSVGFGVGGFGVSGYGSGGYHDLVSQFEAQIHQEVNDYRASQGLTAYGYRSEVADVARAHSQDMHDRDFFDHTNPDGDGPGDRLDAAGVNYTSWAENISWRSQSSITEDDVASLSADIVQGWINSDGHRANLESSMDSEGIGVFINADATELWATELITSP